MRTQFNALVTNRNVFGFNQDRVVVSVCDETWRHAAQHHSARHASKRARGYARAASAVVCVSRPPAWPAWPCEFAWPLPGQRGSRCDACRRRSSPPRRSRVRGFSKPSDKPAERNARGSGLTHLFGQRPHFFLQPTVASVLYRRVFAFGREPWNLKNSILNRAS